MKKTGNAKEKLDTTEIETIINKIKSQEGIKPTMATEYNAALSKLVKEAGPLIVDMPETLLKIANKQPALFKAACQVDDNKTFVSAIASISKGLDTHPITEAKGKKMLDGLLGFMDPNLLIVEKDDALTKTILGLSDKIVEVKKIQETLDTKPKTKVQEMVAKFERERSGKTFEDKLLQSNRASGGKVTQI